ncbi:MAG: hypothetical protein ABIJ31_11095 [Pseudomonadota bacterium]
MHKILSLIAKINKDADLAPERMLLFAAGWVTLADGAKSLVDQTSFAKVQALIAVHPHRRGEHTSSNTLFL